MIKLIIFDFDGTLVDTKKLWYTLIKKALKKEKIEFTEKQFRSVLGLKVVDIVKSMGVKDELVIKKVSNDIHKDVFSKLKKVKMTSEIKDVGRLNIRKIVVSNTDSERLKEILENNKINFFDEVHGGDEFGRVFANKAAFIRDFIRDEGLNGKEVIYLGDMNKDVAVAKEAGCIGVIINHKMSWSSRAEIIKSEPEFVITKFSDLNKIIKSLG